MGLSIHRPAGASAAPRHLAAAAARWADRSRHLAAGQRILEAADDPAGLGRSERLRATLRSQGALLRGLRDGLGLVRTAEGGLDRAADVVGAMGGLAVRALTGTASGLDLEMLDVEWQARAAEVGRLAGSVRFNGLAALGGGSAWRIQVGLQSGEAVLVRSFDLALVAADLAASGPLSSAGPAGASQAAERSLEALSAARAILAASGTVLQSARSGLEQGRIRHAEAESRLRDLDLAAAMADLARERVLLETAAAVRVQANVEGELALELLRAALEVGRLEEDGPEGPEEEDPAELARSGSARADTGVDKDDEPLFPCALRKCPDSH